MVEKPEVVRKRILEIGIHAINGDGPDSLMGTLAWVRITDVHPKRTEGERLP